MRTTHPITTTCGSFIALVIVITWLDFREVLLETVILANFLLTHRGQVTHICVSRLTTIGSDNGLSPSRRQAIIKSMMGYCSGLDIKHLVYIPVGHMVLKIYVPCKNFHEPSKYLYKPCKAYIYCWENNYMLRLKNHLPSRARNHKIFCALGQDLRARAWGHALMSSHVVNSNPRNKLVKS